MSAPLQVVTPANGLSPWSIDVSYDPVALRFAGCSPAQGSTCAPVAGSNAVRISGAASPVLTGTVTLATLSFTAVGPAASAGAAAAANVSEPFSLLQVSVSSFKDGSGASVTPTVNSGAVVVVARGDVNGDGAMTAVDALCVLRSVAGLSGTAVCPAIPLTLPSPGNVKNDGVVNAVDALCILRSVAGLSATAACPAIVFPAPGVSRPASARGSLVTGGPSPRPSPSAGGARPPSVDSFGSCFPVGSGTCA
ncbi:MAG: dockerin type I repeat-containing protein [Dehalococcoidia bacterium]